MRRHKKQPTPESNNVALQLAANASPCGAELVVDIGARRGPGSQMGFTAHSSPAAGLAGVRDVLAGLEMPGATERPHSSLENPHTEQPQESE